MKNSSGENWRYLPELFETSRNYIGISNFDTRIWRRRMWKNLWKLCITVPIS